MSSKSKYQNQANNAGQVTTPPVEENTTENTSEETGTTQEDTTVQPPVVEQPPITETETTTTAAPVEQPALEAKPLEAEPSEEQLSVFANRLLWIEEHGSVNERHVVSVLSNYVAVGLSSVNLNDIAVEQQRFWRLFEYIHNQPAEFQKLYSLVIEFGTEYKDTLFNLSTLFRAQSGLNLSVDQLSAFNNLRTLLLNTIQTKDRSKVKTLVDIRKIVEHDSIPEHIRGMYVGFYS